MAARSAVAPPPPAPWHSDVDAVVWWHRAAPGARDALPTRLRDRAWLPVTVGAFVRYHRGPVGPYDEVLAIPMILRGGHGHVPFMAVDSERSVAGGRGNWALPKELARFGTPITAEGDGWGLAIRARVRPRRLPNAGVASCVQVWPDGAARAFRVRLTGTARLASVEVEPRGLPPWIRGGRHRAVAISGRQVVGAPQAAW